MWLSWMSHHNNRNLPKWIRSIEYVLKRTNLSCRLTPLTHWGRVTHICVSKLGTIGSGNSLSPGRRQAVIWINTAILFSGPLEMNFSEKLKGIIFSFKKMHLKMSSGNWRPFCFGLNVLLLISSSFTFTIPIAISTCFVTVMLCET